VNITQATARCTAAWLVGWFGETNSQPSATKRSSDQPGIGDGGEHNSIGLYKLTVQHSLESSDTNGGNSRVRHGFIGRQDKTD